MALTLRAVAADRMRSSAGRSRRLSKRDRTLDAVRRQHSVGLGELQRGHGQAVAEGQRGVLEQPPALEMTQATRHLARELDPGRLPKPRRS